MKTSTKISLILKFQIRPEEINFLDSLNLPIDFDKLTENGNYEVLSESLSEIISKSEIIESDLLMLVFIYSKIKGLTYTINSNFEDDFEEDIDDDEEPFVEDPDIKEYNKEQEILWKERTKRHKEAVAKYKKHTQEEFDNLLFEYVWSTYPQIKNGFDRTIYSKAKFEFPEHLGFYNMYDAPESLRNKINKAEENVKTMLFGKFKELENLKLDDWFKEYKTWLNTAGITKCNKSNIKEFFKEKGIKASETTIEKMKNMF